ncbi:hypothetical protein RCCRONUS_42 [Rhodobacter phage RcCronus]|uniref:Uncharacterized protein n=2 Tax=Cronusvirus cronus TaxID=2005060 RepID=A0A0K1Y6J3_9CAUD|nr:hypothetical protein FDI78_gp42 [Rhodobacter phage RcCronus]AKU43331.1 hypothetical protein RCCRONUS_42 [Rhodobacter phage RcCronus]AKY02711.1 hypothetical protein RCSAXON_44 [Rhodobacter phage RcSaxon]
MSLQDTAAAARIVRDVHRQLDGRMASLRVTAGLCFPTVKTLREAADLLSDMADLATAAMRDVHDAIPDQIEPAPPPARDHGRGRHLGFYDVPAASKDAPAPDRVRPDCPTCRGTGAEDWAYLAYLPCPECLPNAPWPGDRP